MPGEADWSFLETALFQVGFLIAAWLAGWFMRGADIKHEREAEEKRRRREM